jgi:hypothetical protein
LSPLCPAVAGQPAEQERQRAARIDTYTPERHPNHAAVPEMNRDYNLN